MINFTRVAQQLRRVLQENPPARRMPNGEVQVFNEALFVRRSLTDAEREMAVQSMEFLYSHLTYFEQFREAAQLLAFAMPHDIRQDPRIKELLVKAITLADQIDTPEKELSHYLKAPAHAMPDWMKRPQAITRRALYWLSVVKISRSKTAMEWGTGCGLNVVHCAAFWPGTQWAGVDTNANQIAWNADQWKEAPIGWAVHGSNEGHQKFDCVAVLDTLEHSVHPNALLDQAESWLKPDGLMVITVPNGPWSLHTPNDLITAETPGNHVAVGSPETLMQLLTERGAEVLDGRVINGDVAAEGNSCLCFTYTPGKK